MFQAELIYVVGTGAPGSAEIQRAFFFFFLAALSTNGPALATFFDLASLETGFTCPDFPRLLVRL